MIDIKAAFQTALSAARFFFRSPQDVAVEDLSASTVALAIKIAGLPEFTKWEDDAEAFAKAFGWGVTRDKTTGHITQLKQPAGQWIATPGGHWTFQPGENQ